MKNKSKVLIILFIILLILVIGIGSVIGYNKIFYQKNHVLYKLTYYTSDGVGSKNNINIYNDRVKLITISSCNDTECDDANAKKETFNYTEENMNKLKNFIKDNFSGNNDIVLNKNELDEYQNGVIRGLLLGEHSFEVNVEEYKYKIEYSKNDNLTYIIYFKDDKSILVKKLKINDDYDIVNIDTYSLDFSKKNLDILNNYIEKEAKTENSNVIYKNVNLKKDEVNIINSMVENKESYFENIDKEVKLSYTINYYGIKCPTSSLYLYSDNTYEYYYTFTSSVEKLIPKTGTYNYDITKIINNNDKYEESNYGLYLIEDSNGNEYDIYYTNMEMQEFLESLDIKFGCLVQQE